MVVLADIVLGICLVIFYFLPTIIASKRNHRNKNAILVLNLIGFLFWPWIIAFVWSLLVTHKSDANAHRSEIDDIEKLASLRDQGILTKDEFDRKKAQLLGV